MLVHAVDELAQLVRRAVGRSGREVAGDLVAPGAAERVRHHRQQLDVREAHVLHVCRELVGELEIGERAVVLERVQPPRAEVDLVDRNRIAQRVVLMPARQPGGVLVAPAVMRLEHDRRRLRRHLGLLGVRVGPQRQLTVGGQQLVLVAGARLHAGQEQLPDAVLAERAHRVQPPVPGVEVPDHADGPGGGRPEGERDSARSLVRPYVRAEPVVELLVAALTDQVQVELAERRRVRVRVLDREAPAGTVVDLEQVAERDSGPRDQPLEDPARMDLLELDGAAAVSRPHRHARGARAICAHDHRVVARVRAQQGMRVGVLAADQRVELARLDAHEDSSIRTIPATGIVIQSGRLSSSY